MSESSGDRYWQHESDKFASLYNPQACRLSPKRLVSSFLGARAKHLLTLADVTPNDAVLDVGCGSGVHVKLFSPRCRSIVGIDYSSQMIATAKEQLRDIPTRNWDLKVGDAQALPFPDSSFDWILSMGLLDYVSSPQRVLEECCRVLKDDGHIVFTIPKSPSLFFFLRTSFGNVLRNKLFGLPPIANTSTFSQLDTLVRDSHCHLVCTRSVWTAMWIVKASKVTH